MFTYCLNNPVNMADYTGSWPEWVSKAGGILLATAVVTLCVVAVVALAPEAICATALSLTEYGLSTAAAETVAAVGVSVVAADVSLYAMDASYSAVTGESPVLEAMGGNYEAYEFWQFASWAGIYGFGYMAGAGAQIGVCFVEGTLISTDEGQIPIEEIKPGDLVWAWNEETGDVALKPVVETYINECDELIHLSLNGETITCTPNHPFYVPQKGWTEAVQLRTGDILVLLNGEYVVLEKVQHELLEAPVTVYNFQVEDYHTYFVGESSVRVHNDCKGWGAGSYSSPEASLEDHFIRHGHEVNAFTSSDYFRKAQSFANQVLQRGIKGKYISGQTPNTFRYYYNGKYIDLAWSGKNYSIISFGRQ